MSRSRMPLILGLGAAGGVGYYLYSAGGNTKAAENKFESASLSLSIPIAAHSFASPARADTQSH